MCGIVGYVGKNKCKKTILEGLSRLEYRGYDSAGFVCVDQNHKHLCFYKEVGNVDALKKTLEQNSHDGLIGIGHTRWATHGTASKENAHPQLDCTNSIAVVHNGIIEGHAELKAKLIDEGHEFRSTTDTEVAAHLLESMLEYKPDLKMATIEFIKQIKGVYAFVFLLEEHPDQLLVIRHKSPLAIGIGENEMFVASDPMAFADKTKKALFLPDESFAIIKKDGIELYDFSGKALRVQTQTIDFTFTAATKQGFDHYMLKEIYEQKKAIDHSIAFYNLIGEQTGHTQCEQASLLAGEEPSSPIWGQLGICASIIKSLESIHVIAAGTSWHAGRIAQFFFETVCNIPTCVHLASEFRYKKFFPPKNSIFIAISQSGETADTLECLRHVNQHNIPTIALTNVASSTMVREAGGFLLMQAGPEISVASTKAFTSQLASLYWLANQIAFARKHITSEEIKAAEEDIFIAAQILESTIENYKWEIINNLAPGYAKYKKFIFLGRHISYPFALEAALKLKEVSYIFAQAYPAGELKHGPIALIDEQTPVVMFSILDDLIYQKLVANAQEVKARSGHLIVFAFESQKELIDLADKAFIIPNVNPLLAPIAMSGLMQFFVYNISRELGLPIDKPRNLAKSVTVE
ncbi:glutamine--fructose-6-phosphate transaminase (isomerizing) [Candidatus Dependentiae bacterium]|nr:glutamine--fructose-6-phosphate transaminase (isomerizing) [Candidatus Dependentiae bacterium]